MSNAKGFTLIEVMVAMLLLLSAIALTNAVYSNSVSATLKAERSLMLSQYLPMILAETRRQVRESNGETNSGGGTLRGIEYRWKTELIERGAPPPRFDAEAREFRRYEQKFNLWQVSLDIEHQGRTQSVEFKEVSW